MWHGTKLYFFRLWVVDMICAIMCTLHLKREYKIISWFIEFFLCFRFEIILTGNCQVYGADTRMTDPIFRFVIDV